MPAPKITHKKAKLDSNIYIYYRYTKKHAHAYSQAMYCFGLRHSKTHLLSVYI